MELLDAFETKLRMRIAGPICEIVMRRQRQNRKFYIAYDYLSTMSVMSVIKIQ